LHASISDQLHDLVQNAIESGASQIEVWWREAGDWLEVSVEDNGCGMPAATRQAAADPFFTDGCKHCHRRVGLGLAFLKQMVEETGGEWALASEVACGTRVSFRLQQTHVDVPPAGDLVGAIAGMMAFGGGYDLRVIREGPVGSYELRRSALRDALGELETAVSLGMMRDYIASQEEALQKGIHHGSHDT